MRMALRPLAATAALVLFAFVACLYSVLTTAGADLIDIPLVAAPLVAQYALAARLGEDTAAGWMVFSAAFVIFMPMVMFALLLSFSSRGGTEPDLGIQFGPLMTFGPVVQLAAVGLFYVFARMVRSR
jgi:hypothetical protein